MIKKTYDDITKIGKSIKSVDYYLEKFFRWYGFKVYRYKWVFLTVPIIFTMLMSTGFFFMKSLTKNDVIYVFTPLGGQSTYELAVFTETFPMVLDHYIPGKFFQVKNWIDVAVKASDDGNLLRPDYLKALDTFNEFISKNLSILVADQEADYNMTYQDLCLTFDGKCYNNPHLVVLTQKDSIEKYINITYPVTRQYDVPIHMASVLGGVKTIDANGRFNQISTVRLLYHLVQDPPLLNKYSLQWRDAFQHYVLSLKSPYLKIGIYHADAIAQGLLELADKFGPNFLTTFTVLSIFIVVCSFVMMRGESKSIDWVRSKPALAIIGIISACMAICTAYGVCFLWQFDYNSTISTMPFLALSIGVNDMFIMTNVWHRTKLDEPVDKRLSEVMSDAAVAITITSFTDVFSFAIGTWNSLPAVIMFCQYITVGLLMDYLYQITFFSAAIAIYGDFEKQGRHCLLFVKVPPCNESKDTSFWKKYFFSGTVINENNAEEERNKQKSVKEPQINKFFRKYYGPLLMHPVSKATVMAFFCGYLAISGYGMSIIEEGLQPHKLVLRNHYLTKYFDLMDDLWAEGMQAHILVNNAPNLTLADEREKLLKMVASFENTAQTLPSNFTMFFFKEYFNYLDYFTVKIENTTELWQDNLRGWMEYTGGKSMWFTDTVWGNKSLGEDPNVIKSFRFQVGVKNFDQTINQMKAMNLLREIASNYPEYNITTYHEYYPFADQYQMIKPTMIRDNITAVVTMLIIAFILIPDVLCGIFITIAMITINVGVFGFLALWSVHLDSVSMITLIMAIGFAIDLSCHICYAYICATGTPTDRTVAALEQLGWPVFQGAAATILGVLVLATVDSYVIQTFFKTVVLVIGFGLLHSLVFLPVSLALFLPEKRLKLSCIK